MGAGAAEVTSLAQYFHFMEKRERVQVGSYNDAHRARDLVVHALGEIDAQMALSTNLASDRPVLNVDQFHPWVWRSAQALWIAKHFWTAVEAAAKAINAHTQNKVGRTDVADNDLMNQVFSKNPRVGQKYLRLPGNSSDQTIQSRNRALRPYAEGCLAGIRNPAAHEHGPDWDEQTAIERLAALSVLARWIDECEVLEGR